jgi:hypothetical protein
MVPTKLIVDRDAMASGEDLGRRIRVPPTFPI